MSSLVLVALGSNLGDPAARLAAAADALAAGPVLRDVRMSTPVWTDPVGLVDQPRFLNAAAIGRSDRTPGEVLAFLQGIEAAHGRTRDIRWGPRTLDLDLLLMGDTVLQTAHLELPHPRLHERRFVLEPACAVAAHWVHPRLGKTLAQLLAELPS